MINVITQSSTDYVQLAVSFLLCMLITLSSQEVILRDIFPYVFLAMQTAFTSKPQCKYKATLYQLHNVCKNLQRFYHSSIKLISSSCCTVITNSFTYFSSTIVESQPRYLQRLCRTATLASFFRTYITTGNDSRWQLEAELGQEE